MPSQPIKDITCADFEARHSPADTRYFRVDSGRVVLKKPCRQAGKQDMVRKFLDQHEFTTLINRGNDPFNNRWIGQSTRAFLTDINLRYRKKISFGDRSGSDTIRISDSVPLDDRLVKIAENAFPVSRFRNDPYLSRTKARRIYADIVRNSFGRTGRYFAIIHRKEIPAGFLLFTVNEVERLSVIELIAVDEPFQGEGLGQGLICAMERFVAGKGIPAIEVGTSLYNSRAAGFYLAYGFQLLETSAVYHHWQSHGGGSA